MIMKKRFTPKRLALFGSSAMILGLLGIAVSFWFDQPTTHAQTNVVQTTQITKETPPKTTEPEPAKPAEPRIPSSVSGSPTHISVKSVAVDLPVINGSYDPKTETWTLTKTNAQFATISAQPNNKTGTTYIYGHDTKAVFNPLHNLKFGEEAAITTDNGYRFVYTFKSSIITSPYAVNELTSSSEAPRLSLQTCYGPTSAERRIFHFDFVRVEKM